MVTHFGKGRLCLCWGFQECRSLGFECQCPGRQDLNTPACPGGWKHPDCSTDAPEYWAAITRRARPTAHPPRGEPCLRLPCHFLPALPGPLSVPAHCCPFLPALPCSLPVPARSCPARSARPCPLLPCPAGSCPSRSARSCPARSDRSCPLCPLCPALSARGRLELLPAPPGCRGRSGGRRRAEPGPAEAVTVTDSFVFPRRPPVTKPALAASACAQGGGGTEPVTRACRNHGFRSRCKLG